MKQSRWFAILVAIVFWQLAAGSVSASDYLPKIRARVQTIIQQRQAGKSSNFLPQAFVREDASFSGEVAPEQVLSSRSQTKQVSAKLRVKVLWTSCGGWCQGWQIGSRRFLHLGKPLR